MKRVQDHPSLGTCLAHKFTLALGLIVATALYPAANAQGPGVASVTTGNPEADALIAEIERVNAEMVEARGRLRSEHLDPEALLDVIGYEADDILQWVVKETRWVPYEGALRGASGVLMDRSGSSLDRALLLAELLHRTGLDVRLANTRIPEVAAAELATSILEHSSTLAATPARATEEEIEGYRAQVRSAAAELAARTGLLESPNTIGREPAEVIADHWWVQASLLGEWIDYDPLFHANADGRPPAERTLLPEDLADELRHSVNLKIVIERFDAGALVEDVALDQTVLLGAEEPNETLKLSFDVWVHPEFRERSNESSDATEVARMSSYWRPRLKVGGDTITGEWFSEKGRLEAPVNLAQARVMSKAVSGLGGLESEPEQDDADPAALSAAWIEYTSTGPGIEPRVERREIFDLMGASRNTLANVSADVLGGDSARLDRGLAFLTDSEILLQSADTHPDAFIDGYMENWIELRPALIAFVVMRTGTEDERIAPSLAAPETRPIDLLAMTSARKQWSRSPATYIGRPQIWSHHFVYDAANDVTESAVVVDIVMNDTGVLPGADTDARLLRLEQGVLDTLVEHALSSTPGGLNTWERYSRRQSEGVSWVVVRAGSELEPRLADTLPSADRARIRTALAQGNHVVVAAEPRQFGNESFAEWWRISADGRSLGMGYRGWGSEFVEEGAVTQPSMKTLALRKDALRVERQLEEIRRAAEIGRRQGWYDPYGHLRGRLGAVDPFAETLPIIMASLSF